MGLLDGKIPIVTGGIGRATALCYAREGARAVITDVDETGGQETVELLGMQSREAVFARTDVGDPEACRLLVERTVWTFGRLDVACNNGGVGGAQSPTADHSLEGRAGVIRVNLSSVFCCDKYEIPAMLQAGAAPSSTWHLISGRSPLPPCPPTWRPSATWSA